MASMVMVLFVSFAVVHAHGQNPMSGAVMFEDVRYYAKLGDHQTATEVDYATAGWLKKRLKQAGYSVQDQEWKTRQFYPKDTFIRIGKSEKIPAFPVWWPKPTTDAGLTAALSSDIEHASGKIYFLVNTSGAGFSVDKKLIQQITTAAHNGAVAMIVVTYYNRPDTIASDEFIGLNAMQDTQEEWPIPVVTVMAKDAARFKAAVTDGLEVNVTSTGVYKQDALGLNIIATLNRSAGGKSVLVTTPYSGWFTCAGERGTGIAIFLALAEWAAKSTAQTNWIFAATSGHELRGLGVEHYLQSDLIPPPSKVLLWTHIGAWQAMYNYVLKQGDLIRTEEMDQRIIQFTGEGLAGEVKTHFSEPSLKLRIVPRILFGDLTQAVKSGHQNLIGISYGHEYHHSTQDLPAVTGPELLESVANAYKNFLAAVINEPKK